MSSTSDTFQEHALADLHNHIYHQVKHSGHNQSGKGRSQSRSQYTSNVTTHTSFIFSVSHLNLLQDA